MNKYVFLHLKLILVIICVGCVSTRDTDYYADKAYEALGIEGGQENPENVTAYINGDPSLHRRIGMQDPMNPMAYSQTMSSNVNNNLHNNTDTQTMPFELANTENYSSDFNPSRPINSNNVNYNYYSVYLESLAEGYSKYAQLFVQKNLQGDAQLLTSKASTALSGHDVIFETEDSFDLPLDKKPIVAHQRKVLENVKARIDVLTEVPSVMGQLQSSYDCMVMEAKNRMYSRNTVCGLAHFEALGIIESRFGSMASATSTKMISPSGEASVQTEGVSVDVNAGALGLATVASDVVESDHNTQDDIKIEDMSHFVEHKFEYEDRAILKYDNHKSFVVYYDIGKANLDSAAVYAINRAIAFAEENDEYAINVLGFTDRLASRDYNKKLSKKRVDEVVEALVQRGVAKNKINPVLFGEDYNSVNTRDGVGEAFNRRVVIEVDVSSTFDEETFIMQKASEMQ